MSEVVIGPLKFTYHDAAGFVDVEMADNADDENPVGTFEMDDETWQAFRLSASLPPDRRQEGRVIAAMSPSEARALGLASVFGGPAEPPEGSPNEGPWRDLQTGRAKLRAALEAAKGDAGF